MHVYKNSGNRELLDFVPPHSSAILDIGCGAGDNARILSGRGARVVGVTLSSHEAELARTHCSQVIVADVETDDLPLPDQSFDVVLLSHVLEHLKSPSAFLSRAARLLRPSGYAVIAIPNMANWRVRWRLVRGDWTRDAEGPMDATHLQFWSYETASTLLDGTPFRLVKRAPGEPAVPLWPLRRVAPTLCARLDAVIGACAPNLSAGQVILVARYVQ